MLKYSHIKPYEPPTTPPILHILRSHRRRMMWANIQSINNPRKPQHPESPKEGEEVMYVDLNRDRLEKLYNDK
jgi:hypothetical protein